MKKLLRSFTILSVITTPTFLVLSCQEQESNSIKDYEKPNPSTNDLKRYLNAYIRLLTQENLSFQKREELDRSYDAYFAKFLANDITKAINTRDINKLKSILDIFKTIQIPSNAPELSKNLIEIKINQNISLLNNSISLLEGKN
ncbi:MULTISPECIES: hypothetical protein [unclassified Mycoplasma]|uniref:hypothetical protein n=1 Tax=unclassified Mycoplasma TaxID=2683645 RepID=UPI00211C71CD|nr:MULTISPECIES: hypothetical protein [unclassified Mycoplasma]UUM19861.1 hypothetical protein NPA11_00255 [Mycoplasma sp. 1578d]UUM24845.1 hypothetical protein NPA12_00255 [Mycoplasma sp. 3686d]